MVCVRLGSVKRRKQVDKENVENTVPDEMLTMEYLELRDTPVRRSNRRGGPLSAASFSTSKSTDKKYRTKSTSVAEDITSSNEIIPPRTPRQVKKKEAREVSVDENKENTWTKIVLPKSATKNDNKKPISEEKLSLKESKTHVFINESKSEDVRSPLRSKRGAVKMPVNMPLTPPEESSDLKENCSVKSEDSGGQNGLRISVPVTPRNRKELRKSVMESNSLTCSAVGRKRRILFPGCKLIKVE